jgi:hypothetical protein
MKITKPGLYPDLSDADYRAQHDWLSVSGAKKLLPPSCPAKFEATIGVEEERKPQFDFGKAFHSAVLGIGSVVVVHEYDPETVKSPKSTNAWKRQDEAVHAAGGVLLLPDEKAAIDAMAASVLAHDTARHLFTGGAPEVSAFWVDEATGVQCKARFDYLPEKQAGRRIIVPDLKSAVSVDPGEFSRAAARYSYLAQDLWYCDGLRALGVDGDPVMVFVGAEKESPYLVSVMQFADEHDRRLTAAANEKARRLYRECIETDHWPSHPGITQLTLPAWRRYELEEMTA